MALLDNVSEQRDLGVIGNGNLEFDSYIHMCTRNAFASWGIIKRTFEMPMKPKLLRLLYKAYVYDPTLNTALRYSLHSK